MKLSAYQAQLLFMMLGSTLKIADGASIFPLTIVQRVKLYNDILDQQDSEIRDLGDPKLP